MQDNKTQLSISNEVLEKMSELAACEIKGVAGVSKKAIDIKDAFKTGKALKGVKIENNNGTVEISIYICAEKDANVKEIAEAVQENVKDKIQTMTGTVVTKVNVIISDIQFETENKNDEN